MKSRSIARDLWGKESKRISQTAAACFGLLHYLGRVLAVRQGADQYPPGRVSVDYAVKTVTEITCHGKGGYALMGRNCTVVDIGGQDTKVINVENGMPSSFLMNDKCSSGTGKLLEVMENHLGVGLTELFDMAARGEPLAISSMCTVFAESEVISHIAAGVVESVVNKVAGLCMCHTIRGDVMLTEGLCDCAYLLDRLSTKINVPICSALWPLCRRVGSGADRQRTRKVIL